LKKTHVQQKINTLVKETTNAVRRSFHENTGIAVMRSCVEIYTGTTVRWISSEEYTVTAVRRFCSKEDTGNGLWRRCSEVDTILQ
jgi:hypothetical protein